MTYQAAFAARVAALAQNANRAEIEARTPPESIEALGLRSTNCTPGSIVIGTDELQLHLTFENWYSGNRQIEPPGLVDHELRLNVAIEDDTGGYAEIAFVRLDRPWQLVEVARVLLQIAASTDNWPDIGRESGPLVLP